MNDNLWYKDYLGDDYLTKAADFFKFVRDNLVKKYMTNYYNDNIHLIKSHYNYY